MKSAIAAGALLGLGATAPASASSHALSITDLTSGGTAQGLAESLISSGSGIQVVPGSATLTGDSRGAGQFSGGSAIIGINEGITLSSGRVVDAIGPNSSPSRSTDLGTPGDPALDALVAGGTHNATVLEFDFTVPNNAAEIAFNYVFGSEEYNEYVETQFNDVFAFFFNGTNIALVPDPANPGGTLPAAINNINNGQPGAPATNPDLYVNNDPYRPDSTGSTVPFGDLANTEMDGFTVVLSAPTDVVPGSTNTLRLAIADRGDAVWDSWVFIESGSLTVTCLITEVDLIAGQHTDVGAVTVSEDDDDITVKYTAEDGWYLAETHLHVAEDCDDIPQTGSGNPKVGLFDHSESYGYGGSKQMAEYTISQSDLGVSSGDTVCVAAHAVVYTYDSSGALVEETAWGKGDRFTERGNWAMHFDYEICD